MDALPKPYYQDEACTIYHSDCRLILPLLPKVDLVLTSPPYNLGNTEGCIGGGADWHRQEDRKDRRWSGRVMWDGYESKRDVLPWPEYEAWQSDVLEACWGLLSDGGAIYYNHRPRVIGTDLWTPLRLNPHLPLRQIVIWARAGGINCSPTYYMPTHEWILVFAKPTFRLRDKAASGVGDLWYIPQEIGTEHPAPFPLSLAVRVIETTPSRVVLDPFMGSGTTLRAAKDLGRKAIGVEIEEKYCEIAARRLSQSVLDFGTCQHLSTVKDAEGDSQSDMLIEVPGFAPIPATSKSAGGTKENV